jgi:hypothetical protein
MLVPAWLEAQQREQREKEAAGGAVPGGLQSVPQVQGDEFVVLVLKVSIVLIPNLLCAQ